MREVGMVLSLGRDKYVFSGVLGLLACKIIMVEAMIFGMELGIIRVFSSTCVDSIVLAGVVELRDFWIGSHIVEHENGETRCSGRCRVGNEALKGGCWKLSC
ncbi:hypothetical protein CCP2SC5_780011 [Azospirillaceae bacterium]